MKPQLIASGRVSLGEISASMAHEFNNPLGIIIGFAQNLLSEHPGGTIFTICLPWQQKQPSNGSVSRGDIENAPVRGDRLSDF